VREFWGGGNGIRRSEGCKVADVKSPYDCQINPVVKVKGKRLNMTTTTRRSMRTFSDYRSVAVDSLIA
jgi:hypothetical protein